MESNKDLVFAVSAILWMISNFTFFFLWGGIGVVLSNFVCIILFGSMLIFKIHNIFGFNDWLEKTK